MMEVPVMLDVLVRTRQELMDKIFGRMRIGGPAKDMGVPSAVADVGALFIGTCRPERL